MEALIFLLHGSPYGKYKRRGWNVTLCCLFQVRLSWGIYMIVHNVDKSICKSQFSLKVPARGLDDKVFCVFTLCCCSFCFMLSVTLTPISPPIPFSTRLQDGSISLHSFYPLPKRRIPVTIIPHALKWHRNAKLTDTTDMNIDPPFPPLCYHPSPIPSHHTPFPRKCVLHFQIRLSHQLVVSPPVRKKKKKKEIRKKEWKWWFLSSSRGLLYAIYFDIPPHQLLYLTILCTQRIWEKKKSQQPGENMVLGCLFKHWILMARLGADSQSSSPALT